MSNLIACRFASYGKYQDSIYSHLPEIGIHHVEMHVPADDELADVKQRLSDCGLTVSSLQSICDIQQPDATEVMRPQLEACAEFGAKICFFSAKGGDVELPIIYDRLRAIGDIAGELGVTVSLEIVPNLITNGTVALQTMIGVNHPNIRVNFDTANVYYFNQGVTAVGELSKIIDYVASVHLKESLGEYKVFDFPALGKGLVDFPAVFKMLTERGFAGPYTMELEGTEGVEMGEAEQLKYVADSAAYLRSIGAFGT
ncbi:MAG: sugar phosphate isomerase/epimerase [Phycisphaerae bacterium]|nr:sugar phosphate isomerase/epimerase [Phycisphaerae bacterium]